MIKSLLPMSLSHNPNWIYFYNATDYLWTEYVTRNVPAVALSDLSVDLAASREDILLRASRIGWTFADNFSANWADDERAERFLRRFIDSWIPYCRNYAGTESLAPYMGYLLGMEIRIVQLWTNEKDEWDTKPLHRLFRMEETKLPADYLVSQADQNPFYTEEERPAPLLRSISELTNKYPGWKTIDVDPENGWYPTSYFDVYVDLDQVPKSDLQEKSAEEIIAGLFYELADICQVLRAIVYSYAFTKVVRVASGQSILERLEPSLWQMPEVDWSGWQLSTNIPIVNGVASYTASKTNTQITYSSTAELNLTSAIISSLQDADMQQWQAVKDAANELTGVSSWTFDNAGEKISYAVDIGNTPCTAETCDHLQYVYRKTVSQPFYPNPEAACTKAVQGVDSTYKKTPGYFSVNPANRYVCGWVWTGYGSSGNVEVFYHTFKELNPNYNPLAAAPLSFITYQQVVDKIIANINSPTQGIALLAQAYLDEVAKSILNPDAGKQFVKMSDIEDTLELNKQLV